MKTWITLYAVVDAEKDADLRNQKNIYERKYTAQSILLGTIFILPTRGDRFCFVRVGAGNRLCPDTTTQEVLDPDI